MTITKYRPHTMRTSSFNELANEFFGRDISQMFGHDELKRHMPSVNIKELEDRFELELLVPGLTKEDLKLRVEDEVLTISSERKQEERKENERITRREFSLGAFSRSFRLPSTVDINAISADLSNGVLHLNIPKTEMAKPRKREIGIS